MALIHRIYSWFNRRNELTVKYAALERIVSDYEALQVINRAVVDALHENVASLATERDLAQAENDVLHGIALDLDAQVREASPYQIWKDALGQLSASMNDRAADVVASLSSVKGWTRLNKADQNEIVRMVCSIADSMPYKRP